MDKVLVAKAVGWSVDSYPSKGKVEYEIVDDEYMTLLDGFNTEQEAWAALPDNILELGLKEIQRHHDVSLVLDRECYEAAIAEAKQKYEEEVAETEREYQERTQAFIQRFEETVKSPETNTT